MPEDAALRTAEDGTAGRAEGAREVVEALDAAAVLFDAEGRCVASNARLRSLVPDGAGPRAGEDMEAVVARMARGARPRARSGPDAVGAARTLLAAIRSYARDVETTLADGRTLLVTSSPMARGGRLVTVRDAGSDRMGERRALELLRDAFASVEIGMILWDASLRVQMVNEAWREAAWPVREGASVRDLGLAMVRSGLGAERRGARSPEAYVDAAIARMHAEPRRAEIARPGGRRTLVRSFPTASGGVMALAFDVTEARTAEARALEMLRDAVEALDEGLMLYDGDMRAALWNSAYERIAFPPGRPPEAGESVERHARLLMEGGWWRPPAGAATPEEGLAVLSEAIGARAKGFPIERADGRRIEGSLHSTALGGMLVSARDVTEQRSAEERAREMLRDAVEALEEGMVLYDRDLRVVLYNRAYVDMVFPGREGSLLGLTVREQMTEMVSMGTLAPPEGCGFETFVAQIEGAVRACAKGYQTEMADGRTMQGSVYPTPLGGYLLSARDITERVRAERGAREADDLLRTLVEASPTTFMVSRLEDGAVLYAPPAAFDQARGLDMSRDITDPETRRRYLDALLPTGRLKDWPVRFHRSDGTHLDCLTSARVIEHNGERLIVSSTVDVTERLALEAELERQREAAHQHEKLSALGELLAGVAHELNNPLSVVVGYALMLREQVDDPALLRRVERVSSAAERCARIVQTFLAMARQRPAEIVPCRVNELVTAALDVAGAGLRAAGARVMLRLDPGLPPVAADPDQIAQVLSNLVINAEHALGGLGARGRLTISTRRDGPEIVIEVADNGPGVPEALRRRVFEPFFSTKEVGAGTGVGLAFCHRIVTAHGGRLLLDPRPGHGAVFQVRLPVGSPEPAEAAAQPPAGSGAPGRGHVLVLDDEPDVALMLRDVLAEAGWRVTVRSRPDDALRVCRRRRFDAVVCDVRMPGMDGPAFLAALAEAAPDQAARLAFVTGDAMSDGVAEFLAGCGRPRLEKPVVPAELRAMVERLAAAPGRPDGPSEDAR